MGGGPRVVVSTAAFHVRGSVPGLSGFKETKMFLPHPRVKVSIVGSLCDQEIAWSASDRQGSNIESCVWRTVSCHSSHHPQEVLLAQFSLYVHKGGLKPDSFYFCLGEILCTIKKYSLARGWILLSIIFCTFRRNLDRRTSSCDSSVVLLLVPFYYSISGSFILRGEIWTIIQVQASLLMNHISVSGIAGEHDNDSLSENVGVLFNKYYCKCYMSQSQWVAVSDSGRVGGPHDTAAQLAFLCPRHIPDTSPEGRVLWILVPPRIRPSCHRHYGVGQRLNSLAEYQHFKLY